MSNAHFCDYIKEKHMMGDFSAYYIVAFKCCLAKSKNVRPKNFLHFTITTQKYSHDINHSRETLKYPLSKLP